MRCQVDSLHPGSEHSHHLPHFYPAFKHSRCAPGMFPLRSSCCFGPHPSTLQTHTHTHTHSPPTLSTLSDPSTGPHVPFLLSFPGNDCLSGGHGGSDSFGFPACSLKSAVGSGVDPNKMQLSTHPCNGAACTHSASTRCPLSGFPQTGL